MPRDEPDGDVDVGLGLLHVLAVVARERACVLLASRGARGGDLLVDETAEAGHCGWNGEGAGGWADGRAV